MRPLSERDYIMAASKLGCSAEAIKAVAYTEAPGGGFLPSGRPKILFEAHIFSKLTGGAHDVAHPSISSPKWNRKLYVGGEGEYDRLAMAMELHSDHALCAASWGRFQILGVNYPACGFESVEDFVHAHQESEKAHLDAFCVFLKSKNLHIPLADRDWATFARRYNGPSYKQNQYDLKLAKAYASLMEA